MAGSLIALVTLSVDDVQRSITAIVDARSGPDVVAEFVASIDWDGATGAEPVAQLLGALEHLAEEFTEREISEQKFWFELGQMVSTTKGDPPFSERSNHRLDCRTGAKTPGGTS